MSTAEMMARRAQLLGPNVSTFYDEPVALVRGEGVWVWDSDGRRYLDCYNNCLLYTSPSPRDATVSRMPSSA